MFSMEEGALEIINKAVEKYNKHFDDDIDMIDYVEVTEDDKYDFSITGAERLSKLIDEHINNNEPFETPEDTEQRVY